MIQNNMTSSNNEFDLSKLDYVETGHSTNYSYPDDNTLRITMWIDPNYSTDWNFILFNNSTVKVMAAKTYYITFAMKTVDHVLVGTVLSYDGTSTNGSSYAHSADYSISLQYGNYWNISLSNAVYRYTMDQCFSQAHIYQFIYPN